MKKVVILYAKYGGGHLSAARSLKEYIEKNYKDIDAEIIDFMEYVNKPLNKVTITAYSEIAKKAPNTWGKVYFDSQKGPLARISKDTNKLLSLKLNRLLNNIYPDFIISVHPFSSQMCAYLKKKNKLDVELATVITDHASHDLWLVFPEYVDYFFVSNETMKNELIKKDIDENKIFVTGIPISERFSEQYNRENTLKDFGMQNDKKTVLFFGGGAFGISETQTLNVFESFVKDINNIQIIAVSGKNEKLKTCFENIVSKYNKQDSVKILEYTDKVPELMSISDLVVTKPGGLTSSESLASGLPIIVITPIPGQEEENAEYLVKNGTAIWIKKDDDITQILNDLFSNPEKIQNMKANAKLIAKKNSTEDICKILFN